MQMNLDFCFLDQTGMLAVAGWSIQPQPKLCLHVNDVVLTPTLVTRHVRRDLRSSEPLGVVALFDLAALPPDTDPAKATIHLAEGFDFEEIKNQRLQEDARRLVEIGVDEVFIALLRLMAHQQIRLSDPQTGREISARLRMLPSAERETEGFVLAVDRCQMTTTGQGAVIGWFMPAVATTEPLCALAFDDAAVVPVDLLAGSMPRADLAAYAPRYRFTGRDGYAGGWRFPQAPSGPVRLLMLLPGEHFLPSVIVPAEATEPADLARNVAMAALGLDDIAQRARLRRAMLPHSLPTPIVAAPQDDQPDSGDTLLILDHDLADTDLRDVLRRLATDAPSGLRVHLLRPRLTALLRNGVEGAARESDGQIVLADVSMQIPVPQTPPERVIFARSSTLFQLQTADLFASDASVTVLDPIGTVLAEPKARADRFARDLLPFALTMPGAVFFGLLGQLPACFLTQEARLRLMIEAMVRDDAIRLQRADIYRFFEGKSGPYCESLTDGRDWHAYDAESRVLIQSEAAA